MSHKATQQPAKPRIIKNKRKVVTMGGNARRRRKAARKDISNIEDSGANLIDRKLTGLEVKSAMQGKFWHDAFSTMSIFVIAFSIYHVLKHAEHYIYNNEGSRVMIIDHLFRVCCFEALTLAACFLLRYSIKLRQKGSKQAWRYIKGVILLAVSQITLYFVIRISNYHAHSLNHASKQDSDDYYYEYFPLGAFYCLVGVCSTIFIQRIESANAKAYDQIRKQLHDD